MSIRLLEIARCELREAVDWYAVQAPGLGDAFLIEAMRAFDLIESYPDAWHPLVGDIRRCRLRRYPYGVIYTCVGHDVLALAIAHLHRRPGYWRDRLGEQQQGVGDKL